MRAERFPFLGERSHGAAGKAESEDLSIGESLPVKVNHIKVSGPAIFAYTKSHATYSLYSV